VLRLELLELLRPEQDPRLPTPEATLETTLEDIPGVLRLVRHLVYE